MCCAQAAPPLLPPGVPALVSGSAGRGYIFCQLCSTCLRLCLFALAAESESDGGSTLARAGPARRQRRRQRGQGAPGTASVEQPPPGVPGATQQQTQQEQQQQRSIAEARGQPSGMAQGHKRTGSGEEVRPRKRRQAAAGQPARAADEVAGPSRLSSGRQRDGAVLAAAPEQQQGEEGHRQEQSGGHQHPPQRSNGDSGASGPYFEAEGNMQGEQADAQHGQRAGRRPASAPAGAGGPAPAAPAPQRSGASGRVHAVVDFVKRIVGF